MSSENDSIISILYPVVGEIIINDADKRIQDILLHEVAVKVLDEKQFTSSDIEEFCKILRSLKLILELLEWRLSENKNAIVVNCIELVLQCVRDIIDLKPNEICGRISLEILQVTSRICVSSLNGLPALSNFFLYNLIIIQQTSSEVDIPLRLQVLHAVLESLHSAEEPSTLNAFREACTKSDSPVKIKELFIKLIIHGNDAISSQVLITILPLFVAVFKQYSLYYTIWNEALNDSYLSEITSKKLTVLCYLFGIFAKDTIAEGQDALVKCLEDDRVWESVRKGLTHTDQVIRKQCLYLLKRSVEEMSQHSLTITSCQLNEISASKFTKNLDDGVIKINNGLKNFTVCDSKMFIIKNDNDCRMWWHPDFSEQLSKLFNDIFLILETSEEKQYHIVKPVCSNLMHILDAATKPFLNGKYLHPSWVIVLLERFLQHDNSTVVRWALYKLFEVDLILPKNEQLSSYITKLIVHNLRNTTIYYNEVDNLSYELTNYLEQVGKSDSGRIYLQRFTEEIFSSKWSPEPLFIVLKALQDLRLHIWESKHLLLLKSFVSSTVATHYTYLRAAIQCQLLQAIINMTDIKNVLLEDVAQVLGSFRRSECLQRGSNIRNAIVNWIEFCFSKQCAEEYILKNLPYKVGKFVNLSTTCRMVCLLYDAHLFGVNKCCGEAPSPRIIGLFKEILVSFKDADKRLYAEHHSLTYNLEILNNVMDENLAGEASEQCNLLEMMIPYFGQLLSYIEFRSCSLTGHEDVELAQILISAVRNILKVHDIFFINSESLFNSLFFYVLRVLGVLGDNKSSSSIEEYVCINYLALIIGSIYRDKPVPNLRKLRDYFNRTINVPLKKESLDVNSPIWGRLNSEFLVAQWQIVCQLMNENLMTVGTTVNVEKFLTKQELVEHCLTAIQVGGGSLLLIVMKAAAEIISDLEEKEFASLVDVCWCCVFEARKNNSFAEACRAFINMLYQVEIARNKSYERLLRKYANELLSESINGLANSFLCCIQKIGVKYMPSVMWSEILANALTFGPILRREDRLTTEVCSMIAVSSYSSKELVSNDWNTGSEVRARAIQILLSLTREEHMHFADSVADAIVKKEQSLLGNKTRYFGGSLAHLVRNRTLQTLLVLEPLLSDEQAVILHKWLCNYLLKESHQPSVRYFTEWLIIRLSFRIPELRDSLWSYFNEALEQRIGSLCSFISIVYHTMQILSDSLLESWMDKAVQIFLPYCLAQHFSLRLYAQVTLNRIWTLAEARGLMNLCSKYKVVQDCLSRSIGNGNALKNAEKLKKDFYWTIFHPLKHYSLQTIFRDLPRLGHVKSEEWISLEIFTKVGVPSNPRTIPLASGDELWKCDLPSWNTRNDEESVQVQVFSDNFQKKMIPVKSLLPDYDELFNFPKDSLSRKKQSAIDGLVVVASLVDRIPNLGGLSRTCEIFGVSELVIDSLSILEDKSFQSLAVTAPKWITMREVKSHYLSDYLLVMKREGYTIFGAEQTSKSLILNKVSFPKKSLILLGSEKEGIPPQLIPLLDICVEIPQLGVIRSLNVHVAGALFIWEYSKQHSLRPLTEHACDI